MCAGDGFGTAFAMTMHPTPVSLNVARPSVDGRLRSARAHRNGSARVDSVLYGFVGEFYWDLLLDRILAVVLLGFEPNFF